MTREVSSQLFPCRKLLVPLLALVFSLGIGACQTDTVNQPEPKPNNNQLEPADPAGMVSLQSPDGITKKQISVSDSWLKPTISYPIRRGLSQPLRNMAIAEAPKSSRTMRAMPIHSLSKQLSERTAPQNKDSLRQKNKPAMKNAVVGVNIDGLSNRDNADVLGGMIYPPDTVGDVGPNHYVQWINLTFAVYDKQGNQIFGPAPGNLPWAGFGGPCESNNDGDILVVYDQFADRWVFSQFAIEADGHQCFAVSQTPDPTGAYYQYDFVMSPNGLNDYPKIGVWNDGYYLTFNEFNPSLNAAVAVAVERDKMLQGLPAAMVRFDVVDDTGNTYFSLQPAHIEGLTPPPAGTPNYFTMAFDDETWGASANPSADYYKIWEFKVDWTDPGLSTFTGPKTLETTEFNANLCGYSACVTQPGTSVTLDTLGHFTMYRLVYRNFGDYDVLLVNHTVNVGNDQAGVRWAEIRDLATNPTVYQSSTFAPDSDHRWMGSLAMDGAGNIALGYSVSGPETYPSVRAAARLNGDPLGVMTQGEFELATGAGSQTSTSRWGDYAAMSVDESDDCSFWFTTEYISPEDPTVWGTRISSFSFPSCFASERGTLVGHIQAADGSPLAGAIVSADAFSTLTDEAGEYRLILPAGTYDIKALAYGYEPQFANGVVIENGIELVRDFTLQPAPRVMVDGFVYDGTAAGWPLYALIEITAADAAPLSIHTDPQTGYYKVELLSGVDYRFALTSQIPGYLPESRPVTATSGAMMVNFGLDVDAGLCNAPGYQREEIPLLWEDFEGMFPPEGWSVSNNSINCTVGDGQWNTTNEGNRNNLTGGEGLFAVADSDVCGYGSTLDTDMLTAALDLSDFSANEGLLIRFNQDLYSLSGTIAEVDLQVGPEEWYNVLAYDSTDVRGPNQVEIGTKAANGQDNVRLRFHYYGPWHWWWEIDNLEVSKASCSYVPGALLFGNVYDQITGQPLVGAQVQAENGQATVTRSTPDDPDLDDGFYWLFLEGARQVTASMNQYGPASSFIVPQINGSTRFDFSLPSGMLDVDPDYLALRVPTGSQVEDSFSLTNLGNWEAFFQFVELNAPPSMRPNGPFAFPMRRTSPKKIASLNASVVRVPFEFAPVPILQGGSVIDRFDTGLVFSWGIGLDTMDVWVGSPKVADGDDYLHQYLRDGTKTGNTIDTTSFVGIFGADLAYNSRTGTLWQVNVGGENCIHEINPYTQTVTGNRICPAFGTSERGLAYDPVTDTFFAGSWTDGIVKQFDTQGNILRSVNVGLDISGLAYNPATKHLFAFTNSTPPELDVYVLDVASDFRILGAFEVYDSGFPAFGDNSQAAMGIDCQGRLWAVNQQTQEVISFDSGESGSCITDLPWLEIDPSSGTIAPQTQLPIGLAIDARGLVPGLRQAQIMVSSDTPYPVPSIPLYLTVAFLDVDASHPADAWIHAFSGAGITAGCGAGNFCPDQGISRAQTTVWILKSLLGPNFVPVPATGLVFDDVSPESYAAAWIEEFARRGISTTCGGNNFCPTEVVLRKDTAVMILRALEGGDYQPPPAEGIFEDVADTPYRPWIEELYRRGIAPACDVNRFCPNEMATNADLAVFLVNAFNMPIFIDSAAPVVGYAN